jgi:hypothetical protein
MSLTLSQDGEKLAETIGGITLPIDCSFEKVNGWIHGVDVHFEELQALCLGMAVENDKLREKIKQADYLVGAFERGCDSDEYALNIYDYRQR